MRFLRRNFFKITTILLIVVTGFFSWLFFSQENSNVENQLFLPSYFFSDLKEYGYDYITVKGTLVSTSQEDIASKLNTVEFVCDGSTGQCDLKQAEIFSGNMLNLYSETFLITGWDDDYVTFETLPSNQKCVVWKYRIDRFNQKLEARRETSPNYDYDTCLGIGLHNFNLEVIDGFEVISDLRGWNK